MESKSDMLTNLEAFSFFLNVTSSSYTLYVLVVIVALDYTQ